LSRQSKAEAVNATEYRSIISTLWYLLHTQLDLAFPVGHLSQFMEESRADHLTGVKRVLRYVAGTQGYGLHYAKHGDDESKLISYNNVDMAGDVDTHKSTSGIIFFLCGNPITWQTCKQKAVTLSSCEAEYITVAAAACQAVWLARLLADMTGTKNEVSELRINNQSGITLCKNHVLHNRSKHIDVRYHFLRECIDRGEIIVSYMAMEEQLADLLTKALGRTRFQEVRTKVGVRQLLPCEGLRGRNVDYSTRTITTISCSFLSDQVS
jgi:hypothetical protein